MSTRPHVNLTGVAVLALLAMMIATSAQSSQPRWQNKRAGGAEASTPAPSPKPTDGARSKPNDKVSTESGSDRVEPRDEPEVEVVRVETNLVSTVFTAIDKDHNFITSLRAQDVRIFENDTEQPISLFEQETDRPLLLAILVDTSESQRGVLADEKNAAGAFIESVIRRDKDRAAVVSFTGAPKVEHGLTNDLVELHAGIARIRISMSAENERRLANGDDPLPKEQDPSGYTGIWDAIGLTIRDLLSNAPESTRRAIVLLSDGDDTSSTTEKQDVIDLAMKSDIVIYSIAVRDRNFPEGKLDKGALRKVSESTGGRAFFPVQPGELQAAFSQIDRELRSQYIIAYSPTNRQRDGSYRRVRIEVVNPELRRNKPRLLYRQGYYARKL